MVSLKLEALTKDEARAIVAGLLKDAEQQMVRALWNRSMNTGEAAAQFDEQARRIREGIARSRVEFAAYLEDVEKVAP